jgi:hypothetical protein
MLGRMGILFSLLILALAGCGDSGPPTVGESVTFADVCSSESGARVATEGSLRLPDTFTGDQSVVLRMFETDSFEGTPVGVQIRFGSAANQIEMVPSSYTDDDMQVHLSNGEITGYGERVKVSGSVYFPTVSQDFTCGLENPLVELAG